MQVQVDIEFDQLMKIVKSLPSRKLRQLQAELNKKEPEQSKINLEKLLLAGPTATEQQLQTISNNRKTINQWRVKK